MKSLAASAAPWRKRGSPSVRGCGLKYLCPHLNINEPLSPSVRGCGLKCRYAVEEAAAAPVTLRARVWVEIPNLSALSADASIVTLRARVWVEIDILVSWFLPLPVTLRARVWVEMGPARTGTQTHQSPSVRGCGLKLCCMGRQICAARTSPSVRGCGLKWLHAQLCRLHGWSPSVRGCGLKWIGSQGGLYAAPRHPPCEGVG